VQIPQVAIETNGHGYRYLTFKPLSLLIHPDVSTMMFHKMKFSHQFNVHILPTFLGS